MSIASSESPSKSQGDRWDYEGLQLDTRAREITDKQLDPAKPFKLHRSRDSRDQKYGYFNEKEVGLDDKAQMQMHMNSDSPTSPSTTVVGGFTPHDVHHKSIEDLLSKPPPPKPRRICGLRRRDFWILFAICLALVVAAAIIGGILGARKQADSNTKPSTTSPAAGDGSISSVPNSAATSAAASKLLSQDVIAGSPLNVVAFENNSTGSASSKHTFRMYYQSVIGNVKETMSTGFSAWQSATPIFTDAKNNTGLATVAYLNGTEPQGSLFYVDENGNLQEKRKIFSNNDYWNQYNLGSSMKKTLVGNISVPKNDDPDNDWDSLRIAAVYSDAFVGGPQIRLFYHQPQINGDGTWIQELIWYQNNDTWAEGSQFKDAWPRSHMTATIDDSTQILRLFFSTGNKNLQEYWAAVNDPNPTYKQGLRLKSYLTANNADLAAISSNGTTHLYHQSSASENEIHELTITGIPGSVQQQESFNQAEPLAVQASSDPANPNIYVPFTAAMTAPIKGLGNAIYLFWSDNVAGDPKKNGGVEGGYSRLSQISRALTDAKFPTSNSSINDVPLGESNSQPAQMGS